jgi:hypothetical protein
MRRLIGQKSIGKVLMNVDFLLHDLETRQYFRRIVDSFSYIEKHELGNQSQLIDSFSTNQCESKKWLINTLEELGVFQENQNYGVLACWFGSILIPALKKYEPKRIYGYDMDMYALEVGKHIFKGIKNISMKHVDVWTDFPPSLDLADIIINTSCEHMPPMKDWKWYGRLKENAIFVFQSNNMTQYNDHINCVETLEEFEDQMHPMMNIIWSGEKPIDYHDNANRFMIVGTFA